MKYLKIQNVTELNYDGGNEFSNSIEYYFESKEFII